MEKDRHHYRLSKKTIVKRVLLHPSCQNSLDREAERTDNTTLHLLFPPLRRRDLVVFQIFHRMFLRYSPAATSNRSAPLTSSK